MELHDTNPRKPKATVLVVDDERVIADLLAMILGKSGYRCFVAYDGETGLRRARELEPELIVSDVFHDAPNGVDMAIQIREELPGVKILLISGMAASAGLLKARGAKANNLVVYAKPVHPADLLVWCESGGQHNLGRGPGDCSCSWCRDLNANTPSANTLSEEQFKRPNEIAKEEQNQ